MIKLQFKLPQALISRGFTRRTVFHAPAFQQKRDQSIRVGSKALGLIHKCITGPLWRKIEQEKYVLNMTPHYQKMLQCFEKWANDASLFLTVEESLFPELRTIFLLL